ncbi:copper homeostasis protein CutC [Chromobacterium sp. IIBBL 290-4]|uniref:copper homeostasis protein CutC n=1 Tax=Chromobacterium sp. IIBBL 290-4 TaxID=2953890 RepID=UPI0020B75FBD|nr:copper homeostasis protein CutC [Chromobacterium sp. IIBBL 290-4]UTH74688.1 copper homeostasis protein CutC [Chromobacterium sp. IIBBL 290-4]
MHYQLEICASSLASCLAAQKGGAQRVELCDNLLEGGTTPSYGALALARDSLGIEVNALIRPRGGDFLYSALEFETMARDIELCRKLGVDGVVLGMLTEDGDIDGPGTRELVGLAGSMSVTFHRAFDLARDPERALEDVIASGCQRLLSSGQAATALEGADLLARLRRQAGERLIVMPGAGVRAGNIAELAGRTACREFHASARSPVASRMRYRKPGVAMGLPGGDEYAWKETSSEEVRALLQALQTL